MPISEVKVHRHRGLHILENLSYTVPISEVKVHTHPGKLKLHSADIRSQGSYTSWKTYTVPISEVRVHTYPGKLTQCRYQKSGFIHILENLHSADIRSQCSYTSLKTLKILEFDIDNYNRTFHLSKPNKGP